MVINFVTIITIQIFMTGLDHVIVLYLYYQIYMYVIKNVLYK